MADDAEAKMTRLLAELVATEQAYVEHLNQVGEILKRTHRLLDRVLTQLHRSQSGIEL